jgi:hypothetical protein
MHERVEVLAMLPVHALLKLRGAATMVSTQCMLDRRKMPVLQQVLQVSRTGTREREKRLCRRFLMARPGLEPGTPRFSGSGEDEDDWRSLQGLA